MEKIYFDYAATTPTDPRVAQALAPYFADQFGNPSSPHSWGQQGLAALENSRKIIADFIGARPEEIVFNSGATEANNHAIFGIARAHRLKGNHIIISALEHHSVHEPVEKLKEDGFKVTYIKVNKEGLIDPNDVKKAITDKTILIAAIHASNEIGTIQPVETIGKIARENRIPFLVDAVQTVGHIPVNVDQLNADLLSFSGHKFYGPKGIGVLYIRSGTAVAPLLFGGDQEKGRRASTQNVPAIVGMAKAIQLCQAQMSEEGNVQSALRDKLLVEVPKRITGVKINGDRHKRLPNNAHFSFEGLQGESLLMSLDMANIAASMGSACTSGAMEPSAILRAIGLSDELALGSLRITLGRWTKEEHIDYFLDQLPKIVNSLRI